MSFQQVWTWWRLSDWVLSYVARMRRKFFPTNSDENENKEQLTGDEIINEDKELINLQSLNPLRLMSLQISQTMKERGRVCSAARVAV